MKKNPQIFLTLVLLLVVGALWFAWSKFKVAPGQTGNVVSSTTANEFVPLNDGQSLENISSQEKKFTHTILGFSFLYDPMYTVSSFGNYYDSAGETVLLQKNGNGAQILVTPFDEDIVLTSQRIKKDIPDLVIKNSKEVKLGEISGVLFEGQNSTELWLVFRRYLYQISGGSTSGGLFDRIISTWQWQEN